jgi:hypothetical protein
MRQQGEWPSGLKGLDKVSEVARKDHLDESGKSRMTPANGPLFGKEGIEHLRPS